MSTIARSPDAIVIGAGVVGAACARALAREGLRVLVLDADFAGGGSTGVAMGHIVVLDDSEAQLRLSAHSRQLWNDLAPELPPDCEAERRGTRRIYRLREQGIDAVGRYLETVWGEAAGRFRLMAENTTTDR